MSKFLEAYPPGHFYSPIPDHVPDDEEYARWLYLAEVSAATLDLCEPRQLELLEKIIPMVDECPFPDEPTSGSRFYFANDFFSYGDVFALYGLMRHLNPRRIVEIGSGFSTAVMYDTAQHFGMDQLRISAIDPNPQRVRGLLAEEESVLTIIDGKVQDMPLSLFGILRAGDILFIDSSHIVKFGSEVPYILSAILPRLQAGVFVHIHDIFWPFEYPHAWLQRGVAFNEAYLVRCFLQFNDTFKIALFNSWIAKTHPEKLHPRWRKNSGGSLWLEKVK